MKIENILKPCKYTCASCNSVYTILSTSKNSEISIDVCSGCHPFYVGNTSNTTLRGRVEKLANKFDAGKKVMAAKKEEKNKIKSTSKSTQKFGGLDSL
ncbi:MAG: 50S ribosomal protein L31 [Ureaplasma sp.]|nr:50S ribosomal protein L31 [Ureaplasma sp.]